jgi:hypothetical protein
MCVENIKSNTSYDQNVDVASPAPVYILPLRLRHHGAQHGAHTIVGLIEIILKKKFKVSVEKDKLFVGATPLQGVDESFENCLSIFTRLLSHAVHFVCTLKAGSNE